MVNVAVTDEAPLLRSAIKLILSLEPDFRIVGEAETVENFNTMCNLPPVDIVVLGIHPDSGAGLD
jgi:Response regulator containing a CheY-like receiver domain and an HTH DNA-binding domain